VWNVSTMHVPASVLQALMALLTHTLASFLGPSQPFVVCSVWSCGINMWSTHCLTPHLAALDASPKGNACSSIDLQSWKSWATQLPRGNKTQEAMASWKLACQKPVLRGTRMYHRTCLIGNYIPEQLLYVYIDIYIYVYNVVCTNTSWDCSLRGKISCLTL